jgi:hypothetical protein
VPIDPRRRDEIAAVIAAHDRANPKARLPLRAARLLAVMFADADVCQRSLEDLARDGVERADIVRLLHLASDHPRPVVICTSLYQSGPSRRLRRRPGA